MANSEGLCGNNGDEYGNSFVEVLQKYYAYSYEHLTVRRLIIDPSDFTGYDFIEAIIL